MNEIPPLTVVVVINGEEVEREVDYIETPRTGLGRSYIIPVLLPGEEVRYTADGQIHIFNGGVKDE